MNAPLAPELCIRLAQIFNGARIRHVQHVKLVFAVDDRTRGNRLALRILDEPVRMMPTTRCAAQRRKRDAGAGWS
jgi:hypothetical protein